jgi:hypothetical protein
LNPLALTGRLDPDPAARHNTGAAAVSADALCCGVPIMPEPKTVAEWMADRGMALAELVAASSLDKRVVEAIVRGRYTPSPQQRQRLSAALGVDADRVVWGHVSQVAHVYGHGPQFGRSP